MTFELSCALATSMATPDHVAFAESLGYRRAWLYDSPPLYPDVWVTLARCADRTSKIGLGPGVLVPSLRHPMASAAAIATIVELAGRDRVAVAVGTGFTGRRTLGQKPLRWDYVTEWVRVVRSLLRGDVAEWEGGKMRMLHPDGFGAARPIEVPFLLGAGGPKGLEAARTGADGVFIGGSAPVPGFGWEACLLQGTVLDDHEHDLSSERILAAAGHAAAVAYHFAYENNYPMDRLPGGKEWAAVYADVPEDERHLALHELHLIGVNQRDRPFITPDLLRRVRAVFRPAELRERLAGMAQKGMTEVAYQPAGPDIPRELEAFAKAVRG